MSVTAIIRHRVADFDAWRQVYDDFRDVRAERGVKFHAVWRAVDDPNLVVVAHTFDSAADARGFLELPGLKERMRQGGVDVSSLEIELFDEVLSGAHRSAPTARAR